MPPKVKFNKDDILNISYTLVEKEGIEALNAREIAKRLNSTVSPIFTAYGNMGNLKKAIYQKAKNEMATKIKDCLNYSKPFKQLGMNWIEFANEKPFIYKLLFANKNDDVKMPDDLFKEFNSLSLIIEQMSKEFQLDINICSKIMRQMVIYAHGLCMFIIEEGNVLTKEEISIRLSETCLSQVIMYKIQLENLMKKKY